MFKIAVSLTLIILFAVVANASAAGDETALQWYQRGKQALADNKFVDAIQFFKKAHDKGYDSARLHHAWGAALYQSKNYPEAQKHFEIAGKDPAFTQLAYLNLGLVAIKQDRNDQAIAWFLKARDDGDSRKVRLLAEKMLQRMNYSVEESLLPEQTVIYFSTQAGYEDQSYSTTLDQVGGSDRFMEFNFYAATRLWGDKSRGIDANFNGYSLQNQESTDTEVSVMALRLGYFKQEGSWQISSYLGLTPSYVGGDSYTTTTSADVQLRRDLSAATRVAGLIGYDAVRAASSDVDYAAGHDWQLQLQLKHTAEKGTYYLRYKYEQQDREDRLLGANFYSYSPTRQSLRFKHRYYLSKTWRVNTTLRYRHSEYADSNRINGEVKQRSENQVQASATLGYMISRHATLLTGYEYTDNRSSWDRYTYNRNEYTVGIEWLFL
ncbi:MAG: hypothetical protein PVH98_10410 [Gammaproteobacteria bacterium]|jgi:hypothetical protein